VVEGLEKSAYTYPNEHLVAMISPGIGIGVITPVGEIVEVDAVGVQDGSNTSFTIPATFTYVEVYYNGIKLKEGIGESYVVTGNVITLDFAPESSDDISYVIQG
jgi:hypothetical protein